MKNNLRCLILVRIFTLFSAAVFISACSSQQVSSDSTVAASASPESAYAELMQQANQANDKVVALQYQWTTVPKLLSKAKAAADAGDFAKANELASEALKHAELGIAQAEQQKQMWQATVPR